MSSSNTTPGPWHWNEDGTLVGGNGNQIIDVGSGGEYSPSIGNPLDTSGPFWTATHAESIKTPDAVLIAASPKLLAACKGAREWLNGWASAEPYITLLDEAIEQAEGGACERRH